MISDGHILWAYDRHLWEWWNEGLSLTEIRNKLNTETNIGAGVAAIRDVLRSGNPGGTIYNHEHARPIPPPATKRKPRERRPPIFRPESVPHAPVEVVIRCTGFQAQRLHDMLTTLADVDAGAHVSLAEIGELAELIRTHAAGAPRFEG